MADLAVPLACLARSRLTVSRSGKLLAIPRVTPCAALRSGAIAKMSKLPDGCGQIVQHARTAPRSVSIHDQDRVCAVRPHDRRSGGQCRTLSTGRFAPRSPRAPTSSCCQNSRHPATCSTTPTKPKPLALSADSQSFANWAVAAGNSIVIGGFCELGDDGKLYNSAVMVDADGVLAHYRKTHLWDREKLIFTPGDALPPVVKTRARRYRDDGLLSTWSSVSSPGGWHSTVPN